MTLSDVHALVVKLRGYYGERFPGLLPEMARAWLTALAPYPEALLDQGVQRWVYQHTFKAPSLDELLEQLEYVQDEQRRTVRREGRAKGYREVLHDAAAAQAANPERSSEEVSYARYMVLLGERSLGPWLDSKGQTHPKLTTMDRAYQCEAWAAGIRHERPGLASDLEYAAQAFRKAATSMEDARHGT